MNSDNRGSIFDCIRNDSFTEDGTKISGHTFVGVISITDRDTERTYFVSKCENCGKMDASFSQGEMSKVLIDREVGPHRFVGGDL